MKNIAFTFGAVVFTLGMIGNNVILGEDVKADKNVVAVVNGEEVKRDMLADLLIDMYGNEGLGLLIRRTLVKQESIKRNVTVTEEEIAERIGALVEGQIKQQMKKGGLEDEEALKRELEKAKLTLDQYKKNIQKRFKLSNGQVEAELLAEKIIKKTIKITDEELREAYEEQLGEKILARQIVLRTSRDAERNLERIKTGADFEALAKKESVDRNSASRGGKMRPFGPKGTIGKKVANLKNGEVSGIIKTDSGYHIIKIEKRIPRSMKKFSEVKEDLVKLVTAQKVQTRISPWLLNLTESAEITTNLPE
ncbi:MAG: peptidylprolyl isomerase [Candidatus Scalindua sp.]|nr:peptidylprolyl isomerase [Candidatus Scalindua sp.]